jgi:uncharacterized pyridoxamine 5'-phosphate oxidase family protein
MTKQEILEWLQANRLCYLATAEGDQPHVRAFGCIRADKDGIVFSTQTYKDVYKQLVANPNVELCFYSHKDALQVRVSGRVEPIEGEDAKKEVLEKLPFLQSVVEKHGLAVLAPFCLKKGKATVWSRESGGGEQEVIDL